jgi:hypothetical protein
LSEAVQVTSREKFSFRSEQRTVGKEFAAISADRPCSENTAIARVGTLVDLCAHPPQEDRFASTHADMARCDAHKSVAFDFVECQAKLAESQEPGF